MEFPYGPWIFVFDDLGIAKGCHKILLNFQEGLFSLEFLKGKVTYLQIQKSIYHQGEKGIYIYCGDFSCIYLSQLFKETGILKAS